MQLIPVIDLKNQQVVHAIGGNRQHYQPIGQHSILTQHSDLPQVLDALQQAISFNCCYIADLDAIMGCGDHHVLIEEVAGLHPEIEFWLDNGANYAQVKSPTLTNLRWVIGSESQPQAATPISNDCILSLDFKQGQALGHPSWFHENQCWPRQVIAMTLNQVGSQAGPDWQRLKRLQANYPDHQWIAAGGVRHQDDLSQLSAMGIHAALVATALHQGKIA